MTIAKSVPSRSHPYQAIQVNQTTSIIGFLASLGYYSVIYHTNMLFLAAEPQHFTNLFVKKIKKFEKKFCFFPSVPYTRRVWVIAVNTLLVAWALAAQQSTLGSAPESSSERFPFFVIICCHKR